MPLALLLGLLAAAPPLPGGDPRPEIERPEAPPQAIGVAHTLRHIPEACARIEGVFTGDPAVPYRFAVVRTSPGCQPRARFVDAAEARPEQSPDWVFNDLLRVPSAECPAQQAVVRVWRRPVEQAIALDGQGRSRIYLEDARQAAAAGRLPQVPMYAAEMAVEGGPCAGPGR